MSITVSNCYEISNSPLNVSKAKQLYSFPKDRRFHQTKTNMCENFYNLPSTRDQRSTSFGFGKKHDLSNSSQSPPPNKYNLPSDFECSKDKSKGFSLGLGRNNVSFGSPFDSKAESGKPGPGTYKTQSPFSNISFSMRSRTPCIDDYTNRGKNCPGPGQYGSPLSMSSNGKYPHSNFRNIGFSLINPQTTNRDRSTSVNKSLNPGPGHYNPPSTITETGRQTISKFQSSGACIFSHGRRQSLCNKSTGPNPGPGFYRLPSEFGYYESKNAHKDKTNTSFNSPQKS